MKVRVFGEEDVWLSSFLTSPVFESEVRLKLQRFHLGEKTSFTLE